MKKQRNEISLGRVGERGFIKSFLPGLNKLSTTSFLVPPGDDAAVLASAGRPVLSIDGLTEGTHFKSRWARRVPEVAGFSLGRGLGWKLLGCSLSDLAAMGDTANRWAMIYLGAPTATKMSFLKELHEGVKEAARKWNCILAGGDTVRAKDLSLVAAVGGEMRGRSLVRSGARPNDLLCVAGPVGDASVGLRVLESQLRLPKQKAAYFVERFFRHEPLFRAGALLAQSKNVTSLMDLSDSVAESVQLLCEASKVGAHVEVDRIPVSKEYRSLFDSDERLLTGGEDYALLFTIHPSGFAALRRKLSFSVIGRIFPAKNELRYFLKGKPIPSPRFFEHY